VISLTVFFCAASRRHNDVIMLPATRRVSGNDFLFQQDMQCTGTPPRALATVELLRQETLNVLGPTCGLQTAQISVLWITRSGLSFSIMSTTDKSIMLMN